MEFGTYFYPLTTKCSVRNQRAIEITGKNVISEHQLLLDTLPAYPGHKNRRYYTIDYDLDSTTQSGWDDYDESTIEKQVSLMESVGLDVVTFNSYGGYKKKSGRKFFQTELEKSLELFASIVRKRESRLKFSHMVCLSSPRVSLPVPPYGDDSNISEIRKSYDISSESLLAIFDYLLSQYAKHPNRHRINGALSFSLFDAMRICRKEKSFTYEVLKNTIISIRELAREKYNEEIYVIASTSNLDDAVAASKLGFNAISSYIFLPNWGERDKYPVQDYDEQMDHRVKDWEFIKSHTNIPYIPALAVGWDAWARTEQKGATVYDVSSRYPHSPIIQNNSSVLFEKYFLKGLEYLQEYREHPGIIYISTWNEVTEGASVLPNYNPETGEIDDSYLQAIRRMKSIVENNLP